jgi:predicted dehydrogenase
MKIGIVGYGSIGSRHAHNAVALGHETIVYDPMGPCDVRFEQDVYEAADAVVIATPSFHHESALRAAIERGKHVLIEKPISISIGGLAGLLGRAREAGLVVMMGNNLRFHPSIELAKAWIEEGTIVPQWANFICATTTTKPDYLSDGVILNTGSHEVDLALHLFGPARVIAASGRWNEHSDVMADFVILHESGVRSSFHVDFVTEQEIRQFWIGGLRSNVFVNLPARQATMVQAGVKAKQFTAAGSYDHDYADEMEEFIRKCSGERGGLGATGDDGLAVLRILLDVRRKVGLP